MQVLTEKNSQLSQELDECKAQLEAAVAALKESKKGPPGNSFVYCKEYQYQVVCGMYAHLTIDVAGGPGVNPEAVEADTARDDRQRNAGERVLTRVRQEKNDLQDANIRLGVELKDVRAQLADSVKENKRLRRGIFSKCLNELFKGVRRRSLLTALCLQVC